MDEKFRRQLRQESEQWWKEGLIDATLHQKLAQRYQFDRLEQDASNRFVMILIGLGAVLVGLGAITFVAANWQAWSRTARVILLLSSFVAVNAAGFYLWRQGPEKRMQRLGHGLLLLGALLLGANMGLMSQMFHQSGDVYELFVFWAIGVLAMAYSLRLTSLGMLSLILLGIGYFYSLFAAAPWIQTLSLPRLIVQQMPLVVSCGWIPLAYWCRRSRSLFGLSAIGIGLTLIINRPFPLSWVIPSALLWSYLDQPWRRSRPLLKTSADHPELLTPFQEIARNIAIAFLALLYYVFSFQALWSDWGNPIETFFGRGTSSFSGVVLFGVALLGWLKLAKTLRNQWRNQAHSINSLLVGGFLFLAIVLFLLPYARVPELHLVSLLLFNILLFGLAIGLIRDGLALGNRSYFWAGMILLVLSILSRMVEYDTGLLLKAIGFILCGVGVITAGIWYERRIKLHPTSTSSLEDLP